MPEDINNPTPPSNTTCNDAWGQRVVRALSLSRVQAIVAIMAGLASILGAAISVAGVGRPGDTGTLVATVHMTGAAQAVTTATVQVLTTQNAVVATLTPDVNGRVSQDLREGMYIVRISHPHYAAAVQRIDVQPGQTIELKTTLHVGSSASVDRTVSKGVSAIRRALGF